MRIIFCWTKPSGYMAACWRTLAQREGLDISVVAWTPMANSNSPFNSNILDRIRCRLLEPHEQNDRQLIRRLVLEHRPDVVVIPGWLHGPYNDLANDRSLKNARFVMGFDTPRKDSIRQRLARLKVGRLLNRMDRVVVSGERSWQLARFLKIPEGKICRGVYGFDDEALSGSCEKRLTGAEGWPRRFLYMGRFVPEKGIDILVTAYAKYRAAVQDPWPLNCYGRGPLSELIKSSMGVSEMGFVQPADQPQVFMEHGVLVLPSRYEPWGVVLAEAMASGLPCICSEACGASVELVRHLYNGYLMPTGDSVALSNAMKWMHEHHDRLPTMGLHAREFAIPWSAQVWADRWELMFIQMTDE